MKKETGFILPFTLIVIFIIISFFLAMLSSVQIHRHFLIEQKHLFVHHQLDEMMVADFQKELSSETIPAKLTYKYEQGTVNLTLSSINGTLQTYQVTTSETEGYIKVGYITIDTVTKQIVKWVEGT